MSSRPPASPATRPPAELSTGVSPCVLTGGQTGVDTAAAVSALSAGLAVRIVFPRGFLQEDGPITPARRAAFRGAKLHELSRPEFSYRTWTCVHLADAVVLIDPAGGDGCQETIRAAAHLGRPLLNVATGAAFFEPESNVPRLARLEDLGAWLTANRPQVLMIAGCRASLLAKGGQDQHLSTQIDAIVAAFAEPDGRSARP